MATFNKFEQTIVDIFNGVHNFSSDTFKIMLTNTLPLATDDTFSDLTEIDSGNGYTTGGSVIGLNTSSTGGVLTVTPTASVVFTASGGSIPAFRYAVLYNDTVVSKPLVSYYDYGSSISLEELGTLTITASTSLFTAS